jgi:RNase P subunit RPR2
MSIPEELWKELQAKSAQIYGPVIPGSPGVLIYGGLGVAAYLSRAGDVLTEDFFEKEPATKATSDEKHRTLVVAAKKFDLVTLLSLLPERPKDGQICRNCNGASWIRYGIQMRTKQPGQIVCPKCNGLGWISRS